MKLDMEIKKGIGVSPGVVISTAVVLDAEDLLIPKRSIAPELVESEIKRLDETIIEASNDVIKLRDTLTSEVGKDIGAILDFHLGVLKDKSVHEQIVSDICASITRRRSIPSVSRCDVMPPMSRPSRTNICPSASRTCTMSKNGCSSC